MEEQEERKMYKAVCSDCGNECEVPFQPTEGKTVRCLDCFRKSRPRNSPRGNFRGGDRFNDGPREMHKAVCAECKSDCEVPFKPTEGKPVLCKDCFRNKRNQGQDEF
jgi:CxxC-x17-CxxC domain-containing protein